MTRILAIVNQKGGVGKTTTAVNLAASLAAAEKHVLLIDLDPQGNAGNGLGVERIAPSIYEVLTGSVEASKAIRESPIAEIPFLDLLPSTSDLYGADLELAGAPEREQLLSRAIGNLPKSYEFILIDCPPSLGLLTINALVACSGVLVPLQSEYYALEGLSQLLKTVELLRESFNPSVQIDGVLLTMFDPRNKLSHQVAAEVREHMPGQVYETVIPRNVRLSESPSFGKPVLLYDIESKGSQAYVALAAEFLKREHCNVRRGLQGASR